MTPQNTIGLIIDIQTRLVPAMNDHSIFVEKSCQLLTGLNILNIPLILSEQYPQGLGSSLDEIKALTGQAPVVEKTQFSAVLPEVLDFIQQNQAENIIVIGGETHVCVLQTVLELRARGFNVYLPIECVASRTEQNKANGLAQMQQAGAIISNIESILFTLLGNAKHPAFKSISTLIR